MRLDVKRQLLARSERVKGIDFHPVHPWILTTLYNGNAQIWSYETGAVVKSFEVCDVPVRAGRFIARKNWFITGADDFACRVINYNTSEKVKEWEAHPDYIRAIAVHPTQPFVLTASDDMTIRCWSWEQDWKCINVYEGHSHYIMSLSINPKDTNTFASACLDRTVKIWSIGSSKANSTLEAHETKGVNHVEYYPHSDKPYLLTCSDDRTIKIWDYTTKSLINELVGHTSNVSFACYHPELPVIISGSEDGTIKIWNSGTYRLEQSLNYGLERAWCVSHQRGMQGIAVGFDDGAVVVKLGRDEPAVSMDGSGKMIYVSRQNEVVSSIIKGGDTSVKDNEPISLVAKDLGTAEVYPQALIHSPNGRFVTLLGDNQYIVYTALAWRQKAFGSALDFAWGSKENSNDFAVLDSATNIVLFKNFVEHKSLDFGFQADGVSGGALLGVKGQGGISFFDWQTLGLVRRIEVEPKQVYWSENNELVCLVCEDAFYVLRFSSEEYASAFQNGEVEDDGVEAAFAMIADVSETITTGVWVGDSFIYSTKGTQKLCYLVGDQVYNLSHFQQPMYLLGYLQRDSRIYLADKDINVTSVALPLSVIEFQTLVLRGDMEVAEEILSSIPQDQLNKIARFLEGQGHKELALDVATDPEHKFDLALDLNRLPTALEIARDVNSEHKWKAVGDAALAGYDLVLAKECFTEAKDLGSLLMLETSLGDREGLKALSELAQTSSSYNIAFSCLWQLGDIQACIDLLVKTGRLAEAVLFSQTYKPSLTKKTVALWKESLESQSKGRVSRILGVPGEDEDLFPEWDEYVRLEDEGGVAATNGDVAEHDEPAAEEEPAVVDEAAAEAEDADGDALIDTSA